VSRNGRLRVRTRAGRLPRAPGTVSAGRPQLGQVLRESGNL